MRITDPYVFARRLSRDAMHGWIAFHSNEDDIVIRLGRYPVSYVGRGYMSIELKLPVDFPIVPYCTGASVFSRKMQPLHAFSLNGTINSEVKSIAWMP